MEPLQSTLLAHLGPVPDFRKARGQRFAWAYLLALVAAAVAAGQTTVLAMSAWAEQHAAELIALLRPACPRLPSAATWWRLVVRIDIAALEQHVAAQTEGQDHGRLEHRSLASSTALTGYLSWPGATLVMRRTCRWINAHVASPGNSCTMKSPWVR